MSLDRKTARAIVPQQAAALALGVTLAVMPGAPSLAIMPATEVRPHAAPAETRTTHRRR